MVPSDNVPGTSPNVVLGLNPGTQPPWTHDPSAVLVENGTVQFAAEEERFVRDKHADEVFPERALEAALDHGDRSLSDLDAILVPWQSRRKLRNFPHMLRSSLTRPPTVPQRIAKSIWRFEEVFRDLFTYEADLEQELRRTAETLPPVEFVRHHDAHATSAFHPSPFSEALVVTIDGRGEMDTTVVWRGTEDGLERLQAYEYPNSLGVFFAGVTEFLGFRALNGEGKVMGLAPYGSPGSKVEATLRRIVDPGPDYDVTDMVSGGFDAVTDYLDANLDVERTAGTESFSEDERDLAYAAQRIVEESATGIVERYLPAVDTNDVALAGGVALNCKMNRRIMALDAVDEVFVQPAAGDAGAALGAALSAFPPPAVPEMKDVYLGPSHDDDAIRDLLETVGVESSRPENLVAEVVDDLVDGCIVGWFRGRMEFGPRALGHRSILADPRTAASRDRVNRQVKHREEWRPFAPSILAERAADVLSNPARAPFMIKTFDLRPGWADRLAAVKHPGDGTTRPQVVHEDESPRFHELVAAFEERTGVPAVLNTSFNDHGEPIVNTPKEALRDFYAMGLDTLVLNDFLVRK